MPQDPDDVEVAQKVNPARLVQQNLEALNAATTPYRAAMQVARLYQNLSGLRRIDAAFQEEWRTASEGRFAEIVGSEDEWLDLTWNDVWLAQEILTGLMERHGMGFQALLRDDVAGNQTQEESQLDQDEPTEDESDYE